MAADPTFERYRKPKRSNAFLKTMEAIVPWSALCEVIKPHDSKASNGRPPIGLEHVFGVLKRLRGFCKVRCRGLAKNATRAFTVLALANMFLARKTLTA